MSPTFDYISITSLFKKPIKYNLKMDELIKQVEQWSKDKGINNAPPEKQFLKVIEEIGEVASALAKNKPKEELMDGIGDTFVTLIILCQQTGVSPKECLQMAYDVIAKRKGKTIGGVFVKEEDLNA